jgi:hypothetical protein
MKDKSEEKKLESLQTTLKMTETALKAAQG